eukprot:1981245-Lingulodinium_polyedra.AAC.1
MDTQACRSCQSTTSFQGDILLPVSYVVTSDASARPPSRAVAAAAGAAAAVCRTAQEALYAAVPPQLCLGGNAME